MNTERMAALLAPDSIAVVGASPDSWYASNLIENLAEYGFDGEVYYVNPSREEVWGEPCHDSISDVPVVDLVVVSVPRKYVLGVVEDAGEMGVPSALVITAGFAEADDEGAALEAKLGELGETYGMAICGPNTIGLANTHDETVITSTCSRKPGAGSIGLVSQSGALAFTTFYERAADEDIDFAYIVATGNEAGLSMADYVEFMADSDRVEAICAYIEGIDDPRRFVESASEAVRGGTPVLATKVGRSAVAEQASLSHTGSVTGDAAAWDAAFERAGVERVPDIPDLLGRSRAHTAFDPPESANVCLASTSGGLASLLADMAAERDLSLPPLSGDTEQALLDMEDLLTFGAMYNPADIRGYGADVLPEIAEVLFADDAFDAYVFAVGLPAVGERAEEIADAMLRVREMADDPVLFLWTGRKASEDDSPLPYERVRRETPLYYDPGRCLDALSSLVRFGERTGQGTPRPLTDVPAVETPTLPAGRVLTWTEGATLLEAGGIEPAETRLVTSTGEATDHANAMGGPVVLKVDSRDLPHRSDAGAVAVGVEPADAADEYERVIGNAREHLADADPAIEGVLVQTMAALDASTEVLVGVSTDESFGPVLTVAPGGELVELFGPDAGITLLPPVEPAEVRTAIADTPLGELLSGYRGRSAGDLDALASLVSRVGDLAVGAREPRIEELDLNPVLVGPDGVSVVDILVRTGR
ncbi:acetate--CoA ligase family protein [Halalkalicoccus jeotgali]|uniref:acetate--CoA ligase (ADP-forming) n=1 Tax=Halalkalicoccus jeotgali (strain DSM 18796 / CECT 7217 / JCM 14584 / KCTC 4019 / B3) TaxID=795797 RepID=D8J6G9_HALJB|nr:acetate--CoA ligase [Halalkalicoccus jeotgali]ADJ13846.1 acetyl-CoA synthetase [Halalkalicoccus jeotgali B3]ELY34108.1 acetyl-CoA synthetase [Halalkalicoccus jeotgali B3]